MYNIDIRHILSFYDATTSRTRLGQRPYTLIPSRKAPRKAKDYFNRRIVKTWNALPADLVNIIPTNNSILPFKNKLKQFYFNKLEITFNTLLPCTWRTFCPCGRC